MPANYISDIPTAEVPPAFFLQRIYDYDAMLVLMPSKKVPGAYVIARKRQFAAGISDKAIEGTIEQPDTKMCLTHGVVPVCLMYKTGPTWDVDAIIRTLMARDTWAVGGGDKAADLLEEQEEAAKAKTAKEIHDDLYNRSGDAWRSYQARTGQSTIRHNDTRKAQPRKGRRIYSNSPSGSTAGSGPVTLTD
jgi:hypothetical protein